MRSNKCFLQIYLTNYKVITVCKCISVKWSRPGMNVLKSKGMKKIINFKDGSYAIVKKITKMVKPTRNVRFIFNCYDIAQSLKQKTRAKRAQGKEMGFAIHDEMDILYKITLKELFSTSKTMALLSNILGNVVLEEYKGSKKKVVVVKGTTVQNNQLDPLFGWVDVHSQSRGGRHHDSFACNWYHRWLLTEKHRCVVAWYWHILILLMDLVIHGRLGAFTKLNFLTGKGDKHQSIDHHSWACECHWAREVSNSDWFP